MIPEKMTVQEWNEFARNCRWAIVEPAYEFESEDERAGVLALIDELFGDEDIHKKSKIVAGRSSARAGSEIIKSNRAIFER